MNEPLSHGGLEIGKWLIGLAVGVGVGWIAATQLSEPAQDQIAVERQDEPKPLFYRNPMNPAITSPVPAKDEMGMDYLPVYEGGTSGDAPAGTVKIDPVIAQNIGVRTSLARQKTLTRDIRTVGRVDFDEKRVARLHPKIEGWVEKLFVDSTGERVKKDTMLLAVYSPQLVSSEEEYLLALKNAETLKDSPFPDIRDGAASLARSARERLELLDVPAHQLMQLEQEHQIIKNLHIHSPFDGVVIGIGVREGQHVTPGTELYTIADLSRVWVYVDIYEDEMPWVRQGDTARMQVTGVPGRTFRGRVAYIYPYLDAKTRTNKVRLEFDNAELLLKPDMFAHVTLQTSRQLDAVVVPGEAVVRTGSREQVFIVKGNGKFEPREVKLGITADGDVQIIEGMQPGERVVSSAQFLIDSESKLNEATAKMPAPGATTEAQRQGGMDMPDMKRDRLAMPGDMDMSGMSMPGDMSMEGMQMPDITPSPMEDEAKPHDHQH